MTIERWFEFNFQPVKSNHIKVTYKKINTGDWGHDWMFLDEVKVYGYQSISMKLMSTIGYLKELPAPVVKLLIEIFKAIAGAFSVIAAICGLLRINRMIKLKQSDNLLLKYESNEEKIKDAIRKEEESIKEVKKEEKNIIEKDGFKITKIVTTVIRRKKESNE